MKSNEKNIVARLQNWMDSANGQTFLNYAYCWGASIVILGALFKLTHLPLANLMLFVGMGTEVIVFFLSGFDRPFTEDTYEENDTEEEEATTATSTTTNAGGTIIIGGGATNAPINVTQIEGNNIPSDVSTPVNLDFQTSSNSIEEAQKLYAENLNQLSETLSKVQEQAAHLTTDSEEMEKLNRTLISISSVYEIQLKSISKQLTSIEQINEQTQLMARRIEELNAIYARMISAMTINVNNSPAQS